MERHITATPNTTLVINHAYASDPLILEIDGPRAVARCGRARQSGRVIPRQTKAAGSGVLSRLSVTLLCLQRAILRMAGTRFRLHRNRPPARMHAFGGSESSPAT